MSHRSESILWCSAVTLVMVVFFRLTFDLKFGAMYARVTILATLAFALISLLLSLTQKPAPAKKKHTEAELVAMDTAERLEALAGQEEGTPFFSADVALVVAVSFIGALLWEPISFLYAGFAAMLILFLVKKQPLLKSAVVALGTVCAIQYVFGNLFQIPLPSPSWWSIY